MDKGTIAILEVAVAMLVYVIIHFTLWRLQKKESDHSNGDAAPVK